MIKKGARCRAPLASLFHAYAEVTIQILPCKINAMTSA